MFEQKTRETKADGSLLNAPPSKRPVSNRQHQLMVGALVLLLAALGMLLYNDRNFWFPDTQEADDIYPAATTNSTQPGTGTANEPLLAGKKRHGSKAQTKDSAAAHPASSITPASPSSGETSSGDPAPIVATRTILPPLQVEVVAENVHRTVHPGTNSVHVELQPDSTGLDSPKSASPPQSVTEPAVSREAVDTTAGVTTNAAENVQMSADTSEVVSHSVRPGYPLLARQMKVQGSVILQALINRDGSIQDLHVLSGSPILASAAQEAVRQWRFKPHFQGAEPVETQAKITVNFTISTN